jgi:hypothetical protein
MGVFMSTILFLTAAVTVLLLNFHVAYSQPDTGDTTRVRGDRVLSFDFSHRMRAVTWDEGMYVRSGYPVTFTRNRTQLGMTWRPVADLEVRTMLTNEFFNWMRYPVKREFNIDELIFENLYVHWDGGEHLPLSVTAGRFDMMLGEGFVIMDGTPLDGSRTLYMNGARVDARPWTDHEFTLFYVHQPERDNLLPVINDRKRALLESSRDVAGLYYTGRVPMLDYDVYGLYSATHKPASKPVDSYAFEGIRDATIGTRLVAEPLTGLRATVEGALQRGELLVADLPSLDRSGWAAHGNIAWDLRESVKLPLTLKAGMYHYSYKFLEIDEAYSGRYGWLVLAGWWDPVMGRWPKWSESMVFTEGILVAPAYWSWLQAPFLELAVAPHPDWKFRSSVQWMSHPSPIDGDASRDVGTLFSAHLFWNPDLPLSGHAMVEYMQYDKAYWMAADSYLWARLELMYRIVW